MFLYAIVLLNIAILLKKTWTIFMCFFCHCWPPSVTTHFLCVEDMSGFCVHLKELPEIFNYLTVTLKVKFLSRYFYATPQKCILYISPPIPFFFFYNRRGNAVLLPLTCKSLPLKTTVSYSYTASKRVSR